MTDDEIITSITSTIQEIDDSYLDNSCSQVYNASNPGRCFAVHAKDSETANLFYDKMIEKKFFPYHRMRQDYLVWSGILYSPNKDRAVIFNIGTLVNATQDKKSDYSLMNKGYKTFIEVSIGEPD